MEDVSDEGLTEDRSSDVMIRAALVHDMVRPQRASEAWRPFDNGATVGQRGSEGGVTVHDEEHESGARATLEWDCGSAPWTVTCGIYGWFFHTRFLGSEAEAEFPAMLDGLVSILDIIPGVDDPGANAKMGAVGEAISEFVARFP